MIYWIVFNWNRDTLGAKINGLKAERYWNDNKLEDVTLTKEWSYSKINQYTPGEIQAGILEVAGMEVVNISNLRIIPGDKSWEEVKK